jgi:hypothetical protein
MGMFGFQVSGAAASWMVGRMGTDAHLYDDPEDAAIPALLNSRSSLRSSRRASTSRTSSRMFGSVRFPSSR